MMVVVSGVGVKLQRDGSRTVDKGSKASRL